MFICVAPKGAGTVASPSASPLPDEDEPEEGRRPDAEPSGLREEDEEVEGDLLPPGRTGLSRDGRENEGEREEEAEDAEGRRALDAVLAAREGEGRLRGVSVVMRQGDTCGHPPVSTWTSR